MRPLITSARANAEDPNEEYLHVRLHPEPLEHGNITGYNIKKGYSKTGAASLKQKKRMDKYNFEQSVAKRVLQVAGVIPTTNKKLLNMQSEHVEMGKILRTPAE